MAKNIIGGTSEELTSRIIGQALGQQSENVPEGNLTDDAAEEVAFWNARGFMIQGFPV